MRYSIEATAEAVMSVLGADFFNTFGRQGASGQRLRFRSDTRNRRVACWVIRDITEASYPEMAAACGGGAHTAMFFSVKCANERLPREELERVRNETLKLLALTDQRSANPR